MWDRRELKKKAKTAFQSNYWRCVLVAFIMTALLGGSAVSSRGSLKDAVDELSELPYMDYDADYEPDIEQFGALEDMDIDELTPEQMEELFNGFADSLDGVVLLPLLLIAAAVFLTVFLVVTLVDIFVFNPVTVSCAHFFTENTRENAGLGTLARGFKPNWMNNVGTLLLRDLFLWLWSMLLVVPGVVKFYSYRMVPYIMAEHPELKGTEAITLSRQMMNGNKWGAFAFDLSFLGWELLSAVTANILGIFWVRPYKAAANAELYRAISAGFFDGAGYLKPGPLYTPELPEIR